MNNVFAAIRHRAALFIIALLCVCAPVAAAPQQASQPTPQKDFGDYVPASQLPATELIPAARLLIGAYSFVIVVLFLYLVSVSRRLGTVQREVERLEADVKRTSRA